MFVFLGVLTLLCPLAVKAHFYPKHKQQNNLFKTTTASLAEDDYDIKYLKFNIQVSDTSVRVQGNVATTAQVVASAMPAYVFELDSSYTIDSAKINGVMRTVTGSGTVRTITLPTALASGSMFTAQIWYRGLPPGGTGGFFNGITHAVTSGGTHVVFTISDPYVAKNWWACKQSILDKIDSVDMYITVPRGVQAGSNGLLRGIDTTSIASSRIYHWQTHYPIAYYLISIAIARYADYKSNMVFFSSTDTMLIHNFFMDTATFNPTNKPNFDSIPYIMNYFSSVFGRYPFWREKYGVCYTTLPGGMEHQTMTTIGTPDITVIAHEMCHQWFGDNVTYKTWGDMWLSEGFATYSEQLFLARFRSEAAANARRIAYLNLTFSQPCGKLYVDDTSNSDSLFVSATVYAKGAGVVRMLQYAAPNDSVFFAMLRHYQNVYAYSHATTAQLKAIAESFYGYPLDTFFNQWIYGRGYPQYKLTWNQRGSMVVVKLTQTASCASYTPHFSTYLELQLHGTGADTFVKVYNNADTQYFYFDYSPTLSTVYLNPNVWTVCRQTGASVKDATLAIDEYEAGKANITIYPNPADKAWQIEQLPAGAELVLTSYDGSTLWKGTATKGINKIDANALPKGTYLLHVAG
ncbi:MAG: hypothetical protein EBX41_07925, partial [Chitinophagia bacterium]|nr:hypothetical protein [Chitinophagia bacterium]